VSLSDCEGDVAAWYLIFRGVSRFFEKHQWFPGPENVEELAQETEAARELCVPEAPQVSEGLVQEACRYEGARLISIAAVLGGIAS